MKTIRQVFIGLIACLPILACGLSDIAGESTQTLPSNPSEIEATPMASSNASACLIGSWQVTDLSKVILASIPQETADQYKLQYRSTSGDLFLTFNQDGTLNFQADDLKIEFGAKVSLFTVPLVISMNGSASGAYTDDGTNITTSGFSTSGLTASAKAAGQNVVEQEQIISAIPLLMPPFNSAVYTCSGDSLQVSVAGYPANVPPLTLTRVD